MRIKWRKIAAIATTKLGVINISILFAATTVTIITPKNATVNEMRTLF